MYEQRGLWRQPRRREAVVLIGDRETGPDINCGHDASKVCSVLVGPDHNIAAPCVARPHGVARTGMDKPALIGFDPLSTSWPGLSRPSTTFMLHSFQDVDARHKAGHDELRVPRLDMRRRAVPLRLTRPRLQPARSAR